MSARIACRVLLTAALGLSGAPAVGTEQTTTPSAPTLPALIREYVETADAERAESLLSEILGHQDVTLETVKGILTAVRIHGNEPVGTQPGQEVRFGIHIFRFGLHVPNSYRPDKSYGLVVCLHGAGFTGDSYLERWKPRLGDGYILACPTFPMGNWWTRIAEELVLATIRTVEARYHIDPDRVFLTGMSNGGIGAYLIGAHHATRFAAVVPMAAGLDEVLMPFLENFRQTPLYLIHGLQDQVMPVELSRSIARSLARLGYPHVYREHDRVHPMAGGHFFPREELPNLIAWLGQRHRDPYPKKLTVVRDASHLTPFGWVRIDATDRIAAFSDDLVDRRDEAIANRVYAKLEAEVVAGNRIEVRTQRVRRYTLYLNERLVDFSPPVTVVTNGSLSYEGPVAVSARTLLRQARLRQDPGALFPGEITIDVVAPK